MKEKIYRFEDDTIEVTWDKHRCIHAKECIHNLPDVFDVNNRPWIQPDKASADTIAETIMKCPTGALHYKRKDESAEEPVPDSNELRLSENGPVYMHGNITVEDAEGNVVLSDTRMALCRCGASSNKPLCDNSHLDAGFEADTSFNEDKVPSDEAANADKLLVKLMKNGPALVEGIYTLTGNGQEAKSSKTIALCRCGASSAKPFCDGTHKAIGFEAG